MEPNNALASNGESFVFAKPGEVYAISLPDGGATDLDLSGHSGTYEVKWYDPRTGGVLQDGGVASIEGGGWASIGQPPYSASEHWVALVRFSQVAPSASFVTTVSGLNVDLDGSSSSVDGGAIVEWNWDLGDGATGSGAFFSHAYALAGTYTVTLTVVDDQGASNSISQEVTVTGVNAPPSANFTYDAEDRLVQFEDLSTDDGPIVNWVWDLGDGNTSNEQHPLHSYVADGTYFVTLVVTDNFGLTSSKSRNVSVAGPPVNQSPTATFTFSASILTTTFSDASTDDGTIASWSWDFGYGNASTEQKPTHAYGSAGT
jgi:PKD repeat protein